MCKQITGYFLRLSDGRQSDGRRDFLRVSCGPDEGKRWVGTETEAKFFLVQQLDRGNLTARLQPAYGPLPSSQLDANEKADDARLDKLIADNAMEPSMPEQYCADMLAGQFGPLNDPPLLKKLFAGALTYTVKEGCLTCDQHPTILLRPVGDGYVVEQHGKAVTGNAGSLDEAKALVADWLNRGYLDA